MTNRIKPIMCFNFHQQVDQPSQEDVDKVNCFRKYFNTFEKKLFQLRNYSNILAGRNFLLSGASAVHRCPVRVVQGARPQVRQS